MHSPPITSAKFIGHVPRTGHPVHLFCPMPCAKHLDISLHPHSSPGETLLPSPLYRGGNGGWERWRHGPQAAQLGRVGLGLTTRPFSCFAHPSLACAPSL